MVFLEASSKALPLARRGSSTLVGFADRRFVVLTRHQFDLPPGSDLPADILETIRIGTGDGRLANIPLQRCIFEENNPDEEYHDILIFEAAESWESAAIDRPFFHPLAPFSHQPRRASFLVGYPTLPNVMDEYLERYFERKEGNINIKRVISDCEIDFGYQTKASYLRRYRHDREGKIIDGYSGGAIFSLIRGFNGFEMILDGIVVRAGENYVYIVDVDYLMRSLRDNWDRKFRIEKD